MAVAICEQSRVAEKYPNQYFVPEYKRTAGPEEVLSAGYFHVWALTVFFLLKLLTWSELRNTA